MKSSSASCCPTASAISRAAVPAAQQNRPADGVDDFLAAVVPVVHAFGADDELGIRP